MTSPSRSYGLITNTFVVSALLIGSGGLQTASLAPYNIWGLSVISIALLLWSTQLLDGQKVITTKQSAFYGWLFGIGLFGSGASWVYVSIHNYGYASPALAFSLTALFVMGLALFHALLFFIYIKLRTPSLIKNGLIFSCLWVLGDGFRTVFLTGFPWLFLGYSHLDSPLSGWTPIIGVYGLSLISVFSGVALFLCFTKTPKKHLILFSTPVLILWIIAPVLKQVEWTKKVDNATQSVALLQLNIPQELKWQPQQRMKTLALLEQLSAENWDKDILVWPETAVPILMDRALPFLQHIGEQAETQDTTIISGIPYREYNQDRSQTLHNSIISFGTGKGIYHKQKLVPFGEYVPLQDWLRGLIAFFDLPMSDFRKGPSHQAYLNANEHVISPFICYEVVYPDFVNSRSKDVDILLTISNDSWFGESIGPLQHLQMAQMRAAEQGRYMIRATNNGISAIIDQTGQIKAQSEQFVQTTLSSEVDVYAGRTPFSYLGSYPVFIFCLSCCALIVIRERNTA